MFEADPGDESDNSEEEAETSCPVLRDDAASETVSENENSKKNEKLWYLRSYL